MTYVDLDSLLQTLKDSNPQLNFSMSKDGSTIVVEVDRFAFGVLTADRKVDVEPINSAKRMTHFFKMQRKMIEDGLRGYFAVVFPNMNIKVYETSNEANSVAYIEGNCFVYRIGVSFDLFDGTKGVSEGSMYTCH